MMYFFTILLLTTTTHVNAIEYLIGKAGDFCETSPLTLSQCRAYAEETGKPIDIDSRSDVHPGCSLTKDAVSFNQNYESVTALATYRPICSTAESAGAGGPHYFGFGQQFFKWHGDRDVILLKTPFVSRADPGMEVHIRTKMQKKWSVIDIIAVKVGDDIAEIMSKDGKLFYNGEHMETVETRTFSVLQNFSGQHKGYIIYDIIFGDDKRINIKANTDSETIYVTFNGYYPRGTTGLLGSPYDPGLMSRDGQNMTGFDMNLYAETWQVADSDPQIIGHHLSPSARPSKKTRSRIRASRRKKKHVFSLTEAVFVVVAVCFISISIKISM